MRWLVFFGATVFAVTASGQCIEGVPAAYPLGEQVALHVLDPDCSFEAKWKKHLADPSVDSVGLIYHERISVPAMELMKSNPSSGQTLAVWGLDGESSTKATTTTATDIGGDYSAYVLTVQAPSCNSARIGSIVTTPNKTEVAGFVRKVIEGPQCTLHVIKPSSIRSLLSVQVPVGAPVVKLNGVASRYVPLKMAEPREPAADVVTRNASTDSHREPRDGAVPLVLVLKKEKLSGAEGHCIMNLCMAATYDPDPSAPMGFRVPFNMESGELIVARWKKWRAHDPINLVTKYRDNLKSMRGIYVDCGWRDQYHIHYGSRILAKRLTAAGIAHTYEEFDDNHSDIDYRMDVSLPYLYRVLKP